MWENCNFAYEKDAQKEYIYSLRSENLDLTTSDCKQLNLYYRYVYVNKNIDYKDTDRDRDLYQSHENCCKRDLVKHYLLLSSYKSKFILRIMCSFKILLEMIL